MLALIPPPHVRWHVFPRARAHTRTRKCHVGCAVEMARAGKFFELGAESSPIVSCSPCTTDYLTSACVFLLQMPPQARARRPEARTSTSQGRIHLHCAAARRRKYVPTTSCSSSYNNLEMTQCNRSFRSPPSPDPTPPHPKMNVPPFSSLPLRDHNGVPAHPTDKHHSVCVRTVA